MENQEEIIIIDKKELKDIIHNLKAYVAILEKVYKETKKKKPFQNVLLSQLVDGMNDVNKLIKKLERK